MPTNHTTAHSPARNEQSLQEELLEEMFPAEESEEAEDTPDPTTADTTTADTTTADTIEEQPADLDTQLADDGVATEAPLPPEAPSAGFVAQRAGLERRIAASQHLPPAIRQHLTRAIEQATWDSSGQEQPTLSIGQTIQWLESTLPRQFALDQASLVAPEHPGGSSFFSGPAEALNDQQAAQVAADQLAATGFGPRG